MEKRIKRNIGRGIGIGILVVIGVVLFVTVGGVVVRELWNWLLPQLFGWPLITFSQAIGLLVLSRILFGGFGGPGRHHHKGKRGGPLSPEEKEHLKHSVKFISNEDEA